MRELKFRAYHPELKEFIYWEINGKSTWFWDQVREYNLKADQFTCLLDKNGKDIYEGDILQIKFNINNILNMKVYFNKGSFVIDCYKLSSIIHEAEISGNIHENPEL